MQKHLYAPARGRWNYMLDAQAQYLMAVSALMTIPMIVLFFVAQRYFIRGIVLTGINR